VLAGEKPSAAAFARSAKAILAGAKPHQDNGFKVTMAERAIVEALSLAAGAA
jgi:xanthine dehydrogenase YagS FAD-binding subunit